MRRLLIFLLIALVWLSASQAATVDEGLQAFRGGDYGGALDTWLSLSEQGNARATYYLSLLYAQGKGVKKNTSLAMEFLAAAAKGGHAVAQFNLGNHYNQGKWVKEDPRIAAYWWRMAAAQGMQRAEHNLGSLYLMGRGVDKDVDKALEWYERAALHGSKQSREMAEQLKAGQGNPQLAKAERAAVSGQPVHPEQGGADRDGGFPALGHDWINRQPGEKYTLQVIASESAESVRRLLARHKFNRQVAVYQFDASGRHLYGIGYGRFLNRDKARAAISELPDELRGNGPWPRRFADIQAIIR